MSTYTQRIEQLADRVERLEAGHLAGQFDMNSVKHVCGAPACIAGWAVNVFGDLSLTTYRAAVEGKAVAEAVMDEAANILGLREDDAEELFWPVGHVADVCAEPGQQGYVSPAMAAACLRLLVDTGEVDWRAAREATE